MLQEGTCQFQGIETAISTDVVPDKTLCGFYCNLSAAVRVRKSDRDEAVVDAVLLEEVLDLVGHELGPTITGERLWDPETTTEVPEDISEAQATPYLEPIAEPVDYYPIGASHVGEIVGGNVLERILGHDRRDGRHCSLRRGMPVARSTPLSGGLNVLGHVWPEHRAFGTEAHAGDPLMGCMKCVQHAVS